MDRANQQKEANVRHAGRRLAAISPENQVVARRFVDWKVHRDRRTTATATFSSQIARDLDRVLRVRSAPSPSRWPP